MTSLSAAATLDLWERAEPLPSIARAVLLAGAVHDSGAGPVDASSLPLGRRDAALLRLRVDWAGSTLDATATCPQCREHLEFTVDAEGLFAVAGSAAAPQPVVVGDFAVAWRPPDSLDLLAASEAPDAAAAEGVLLARCVTSIEAERAVREPTELPSEVRAALADAMASADPLAEVLVDLACGTCGASFAADLDVASFVWSELQSRAAHLLRDIDTLARAYGWTEGDVLALSDARRAAYVAMAVAGAS